MSDLVERLLAEQILQQDEYSTTTMRRNPDGPEAAARITELETSLAEARRQALEEAVKACEAERLSEPQDDSDAAYDRAIDHCAQAIRAIASDPLLDRQGKEGV